MAKPMIEPAIISFIVCRFKVILDHAIRIVKTKKSNPATKFMGLIKKDNKMLNETCNEHLTR